MDEVANLLLRIVAEDEGGEKTLEDLQKQLEEFSTTSATAEAKVETLQARSEINSLQRDLLRLDAARAEPEVKAQIAEAFIELQLLNQVIDAVDRNDITIDVDLRRDIFDRLQQLRLGINHLTGDLNTSRGAFGRFGVLTSTVFKAIPILTANLLGVGRAFTHIQSLLGNATEGMGLLARTAATAGVAAGVIAILWTVLAVVFSTVAAAATALAIALGAAIAQLAALATAGIAALGPIAVLAIAVAARIAAIVQALKAQKQAQQQVDQQAIQSQQQQIAAAERIQAANERVADAEDQVRQAAERVKQATVDAFRAMEDAAERASDAVRGVAEAQLSLDEAKLSVKEAEQALKDFAAQSGVSSKAFDKFTNVDFRFDPSALGKILGESVSGSEQIELTRLILNVRRAKLQEREATDRLDDSERELKRSRQDNISFLRQGIAAYGPYISAIQGAKDANKQLQKAIQGVSDAKRDNKLAADQLTAAQAKAQVQAGHLTGTEKVLLGVLQKVGRAWKLAFSGATNAIIGSLARALLIITPLIKALSPLFTILGRVMGRAIEKVAKTLAGMGPQFAQLIGGSIQLIGPFTRIFIAFLKIFLNIARAAMPLFIAGIRKVAKGFEGWASGTDNISGLRSVFKRLAPFLGAFVDLFVAFGKIFLAIFTAAEPLILEFVQWLAKGAQELAKWMQSKTGQEAIKSFFTTVLPLVKEVIKFIGLIIVNLLLVGQAFAPWFTIMLKINNFILKSFNAILALLIKLGITGPQVFARIVRFAANLGKKIGNALKSLGPIISSVWDGIKTGASIAWNGIKTVVMAPIRFIARVGATLFRTMKGVLGTIWDGIKSLATRTWEGIKDRILSPIRRAIQLIRDLGEAFFKAGKFIIQKLIDGVTFMADKAVDAVKGVVGKVTDVLPFSEPKDASSPLRGLGKSGEALIDNFIAGITKRAPHIASELQAALSTVPGSLSVRALGPTPTTTPAFASGGSSSHIIEKSDIDIHLPPAPPAQVPDAEFQAAQLQKALRRRGF